MSTEKQQQQPLGMPADIDFEAFGGDEGSEASETELTDEGGDLSDEVAAEFGDDAEGQDVEAKAEEADGDEEDADLDDIEGDDATADDAEFEIEPDLKLTKSEIKEMVAKRADYNRYSDELQIVGREREALTAQSRVVFEEFPEKLRAEYEAALSLIASNIPAAPDVSLMTSDPSSYLMLKEYREQAIANYQQAKQKGDEAMSRMSAEHKAAQDKIVHERQGAELDKLLKAVPALKDERKANIYLKSCVDAGKRYGYSDKETNEAILGDHRVALILRKAALYDQIKSGNKQPIQAQTKAATPPRAVPAPKRSTMSSQPGVDRKQLAKSLSNPNASRSAQMDAAAAYFAD